MLIDSNKILSDLGICSESMVEIIDLDFRFHAYGVVFDAIGNHTETERVIGFSSFTALQLPRQFVCTPRLAYYLKRRGVFSIQSTGGHLRVKHIDWTFHRLRRPINWQAIKKLPTLEYMNLGLKSWNPHQGPVNWTAIWPKSNNLTFLVLNYTMTRN